MSRVQKDRLLKLNLKEKKLIRLLYHQGLSEQDTAFINTVYEEKQHLHFYYCLVFPGFFALSTNYMMFRQNSKWMQLAWVVTTAMAGNLYLSTKVNHRFHNLVSPYFEKYQIN